MPATSQHLAEKKDLIHECVLVFYECSVCKRDIPCTYELLVSTDGKEINSEKKSEFGFFNAYYERVDVIKNELSYNTIHNRSYKQMWEEFALLSHNSITGPGTSSTTFGLER